MLSGAGKPWWPAWRPANARHKSRGSARSGTCGALREARAARPTGPATARIGCSVAFPRSHWLPWALAQPPYSCLRFPGRWGSRGGAIFRTCGGPGRGLAARKAKMLRLTWHKARHAGLGGGVREPRQSCRLRISPMYTRLPVIFIQSLQ